LNFLSFIIFELEDCMGFSRSAFDLAIGKSMILYHTTETRSELDMLQLLRVKMGTGGGALSLGTEPRTGSDQFPSQVLVCLETNKPVGMLSSDFIVSGQFGIVESDAERIAIAEAIATQYDRVTYETSIQMFG
jgi:hypothetical protein